MTITLPTVTYTQGQLRTSPEERVVQLGDQIIAINLADEPDNGRYRAYRVTTVYRGLNRNVVTIAREDIKENYSFTGQEHTHSLYTLETWQLFILTQGQASHVLELLELRSDLRELESRLEVIEEALT